MAKEIQVAYTTGLNLYVLITNSVGQVYDAVGASFVTYNTADLADYDIALTQLGTAGQIYTGDMPAIAAGVYGVTVFQRLGGSPDEADTLITAGTIEWDGSATCYLASRLAPTVQGRTLDVAAGTGGVRLSAQGVTDVGSGVWTANTSAYSGINDFGYQLQPIYYADIKQYYDFDNTRDEYAVDWFNGHIPLPSGSVTSAFISVYNTSNGTPVFLNGVLNNVSVDVGTLRYNDASNLLVAGEPYNAVVSGTINGSNRVWQKVIGRNKLS